MIIIGCNTITFEKLLVENSGRSGVDFIGCNNITINNLEAKNNGGAGIAVKTSSSVMVSNITTSGNIWQEYYTPFSELLLGLNLQG